MLAFVNPISHIQWKRHQKTATYKRSLNQPEVYDFVIQRMKDPTNGNSAIPKRVTLLRLDPKNPSHDQLLIDQIPIPRDAWHYNSDYSRLFWKGAYGGGELDLYHLGRGAAGVIGSGLTATSVQGLARSQYSCDVALNTGATYTTTGDAYTGFTWDPTSPTWKQADWIKARLLLTFTLTDGTITDPGQLTFEFADLQTGASPWIPDEFSFSATLTPVDQNGQLVWSLSFQTDESIPSDQGTTAPSGPDSVFPSWIQAIENAWEGTMNGVMQIDDIAPNGTLVGLQGQRTQLSATGYYRTSSTAAPFGVFEGRLMLDGKPVAHSSLSGNQLSWSGLDPEHQQRTDLPASGCLSFHSDGSCASDSQQQIQVHRLSTTVALDAIAQHADLHPTMHQQILTLRQTLTETAALNPADLWSLSPMAKDANGNWYDSIQAAVTGDLSQIMNSFIPGNLWQLVYPGITQPTLTGYLAEAANTPVAGVANPGGWYQALATAVLTQGLAGGSDSYCKYLNGPRAAQWLKTQVAGSAVYQTHSQVLFGDEWQAKTSVIGNFLTDQQNGDYTPPSGPGDPGGAYYAAINSDLQKQITDINTNVIPDPTNPTVVQQMIDEVTTLTTYAIESNLYWAYEYYARYTNSGMLGSIAAQMQNSTDGSVLAQNMQTQISVLTALDGSGVVAKAYVKTINIFLGTNILPSMFSFDSDEAVDGDLMLEYLQYFVKNVLTINQNPDITPDEAQQIQAMANTIGEFVASADASQKLQDMITAIKVYCASDAGLMPLGKIASNLWTGILKPTDYPKLSALGDCFAGAFVGGMAAMGIFGLILNFKAWDQLKVSQRYAICENAVQLGLQIVSGIIRKVIRIGAIFRVDGMTKMQRLGAISKIILSGEAEELDQGLSKIGNSFARYLGDTAGSTSMFLEADESIARMLVTNSTEEEVGWAAKIFGRNLEETMATRIGPIFILAGMAYGMYCLIEDDKDPLSISNDALGLAGGALSLFALVGEWAVAAELVAEGGVLASFISAAGPLAIIVALAGVALMLYEMFRPPAEDPVQQFLDTYATPAGFGLADQAASIDYAVPYANPDQDNLMMQGFILYTNSPDAGPGECLQCKSDGSFGLLPDPTLDPSCVWVVKTDGLGMSQIMTTVQLPSSAYTMVLYLSMMSDGSVSFQPQGVSGAIRILKPGSSDFSSVYSRAMPTVVTQTWWSTPNTSTPPGTYQLTSNKMLKSLGLTLQAVRPDAKGNYAPSQVAGYLTVSNTGVYINPNWTLDAVCWLTMSGVEPSFLRMKNLTFYINTTPSKTEKFTYSCAALTPPSTSLTYTLEGTLPYFLNFDTTTGTFTPNGQSVSVALQSNFTLTVANSLGHESLPFGITATTYPKPPTPSTATAFSEPFIFQPG